jgi:hypothetical protein
MPTPSPDEARFRSDAQWLLTELVTPAPEEVFRRFVAELPPPAPGEDPSDTAARCGAALAASHTLLECAALAARYNALRSAPTDDAHALHPALERVFFIAMDAFDTDAHVSALAEFAPRHFDANADDAPHVRVVCHPEFGPGFPRVNPPASYDASWSVDVTFRDATRHFEDDAARWDDPRETFLREAGQALLARIDDAPEDAFWRTTATLGWSDHRHDIAACAAELRRRVDYVGCVAMHARLFALTRDLAKRIEAWEASSGQRLACGDDGYMDLKNHIVGLGRDEYHATLEEPARALRRAEERAYAESFAYVFQSAEDLYPVDEVARALRAHGAPQSWGALTTRPERGTVVDHPDFGLGVVAFRRAAPGSVYVAFSDRERELPVPA